VNLAETHDLLTLIAVYDNRRFDDATVLAWHEVLGDRSFADCRIAVVKHFGSSHEYLMPVHVRQGAAEIGRRRAQEIERAERLAIEADPTRRDRSLEVHKLIAELRASLPPVDPRKVSRRNRRRGAA
jgi:hypothetical protein